MEEAVSIRLALAHEQALLEALQWRASLNNERDHEALLANLDAITVPIEQIVAGCVFVAEHDGIIAVTEAARARAASFLHVVGNPHAEGFYVACGFRAMGIVNTPFGVGLDMRRSL
jgi:hypothetical protein